MQSSTSARTRVKRLIRVDPMPPSVDLDRADDCPTVGGLTRRVGRLGAGHAAFLTLVYAAGVVTSRADQVRDLLGEQWQVLEV